MLPSSVSFSRSVVPGRTIEPGTSGARETALALRLFALAVACACGSLIPAVAARPMRFFYGIVAGALLALLQDQLTRRAQRVAGPILLGPHLLLWTYLISASGGIHSPLVAGYLFEVPLAGVLMGQIGVIAASIGASIAIALSSRWGSPAVSWSTPTASIGFIGVAAVLTSWLLGVMNRQQRELADSHEALRRRADGLAEELRLLGDYLSCGLLTVDELGRVAHLNPAGAAMLGVTPIEAQGYAWQEVLRAAGACAADLASAILGVGTARGLHLLVGTGGHGVTTIAADVWTGTTQDGNRTYVLFDAPAASETEGADPLRRLGEAAASVSHQIKNSLHALSGFARQLARASGNDGSPVAEHLQHALGTLGELSEDVLAMSGAPRAEELVPLASVLASAVTLARRADVEIEVRGAAVAGVRVWAHRGRLVHALFNLIDNACRVTPKGSAVEVEAGWCGGAAWIEICDRGPGPPLASNGGPYRATQTRQSQGSGMGLVATRRFLESFGAHLEFMPRDGGGARCHVRLHTHAAALADRPVLA